MMGQSFETTPGYLFRKKLFWYDQIECVFVVFHLIGGHRQIKPQKGNRDAMRKIHMTRQFF